MTLNSLGFKSSFSLLLSHNSCETRACMRTNARMCEPSVFFERLLDHCEPYLRNTEAS